jgi:GNAT superfamily N-acetyltransferase
MTFSVRPYHPGDEESLVALWNACLPRDLIAPTVFQAKVLLDPNFDPLGLLLAQEGKQIVGFLLALARRYPLFSAGLEELNGWITAFAVHPAQRRRGVGRALLAAGLQYLRARGRKLAWFSPYAPGYFTPGLDAAAYPDALAFLQAQGFVTAYQALSMERSLADFRYPPEATAAEERLASAGIIVRPYQPNDLWPLLAFTAQFFRGDWERFLREALARIVGGEWPGDVVWVARDDRFSHALQSAGVACEDLSEGEEIVGYCQHTGERFGPFGVREDYRGRGIGLVLLCHCLERMKGKSHHNAWFLWAGERAAHLYARVGFHEARRFAVLQREL